MSANLIVGKDPTGNKVPVAVDAAGKLQIGGVQLDALNLNTDQIEGKQDVTNALLTTQAADLAAVKAQLATGTIAVTGGGGGGGGASAQYNSTLPTYTSGATATLQTDVNGRLLTNPSGVTQPVSAASLPLPSGAATSSNQSAANTSLANLDADLGNVADAAASSDAGSFSLIALFKRLLGKLTDGITANNAATQVYNYTATGAVSANTVLIGSLDCSQFREIALHVVSLGSGANLQGSLSNDGTNWVTASYLNNTGAISSSNIASASTQQIFQVSGFRYFRITNPNAQTSGTTTLVAYASQQATPKLYQSVSGTVNVGSGAITPGPTTSTGFSLYHTLISAASTNATSVKASAGVIGTCVLTNTTASFKFVKFFNKASAPTVGTDSPVIQFPIPPNSSLDVSTAFAGLRLSTGIAYAITGAAGLTDSTSVAAGDVTVNMTYV